ncbi:coatomer protein complex subunit beta, putative [Eimeria maxima]|uniref:Beta'-coat protein n=1 Tax=Eimeria maxima TaxID=5804 RepID=U6M3Y4_EIMMA|nr:coatomer protein complex subunit beta, putative [Eimeria maxima]CDJ57778.1 coatomer protein complex subunit beta, putative [Eimeria maxima]
MTIKLWDLDDGWARLCSFEGHSHYVMQAVWSPRDSSIFASCSLDRSIKVWGIGSYGAGSKGSSGSSGIVSSPHFTLLGHERGVNAIAYSNSGERPYLVSGADDATVRVWDYQTKQCIQVLTGHNANVCAVLFPVGGLHAFPVLVSGDIFPQSISHHPNGRFIAVVGDGEYVIYTAQAYNFTPPFIVEEIFGGYLLGLRSEDAICFYDWNSYRLIRRIEALPTAVYWSDDGLYVALVTKEAGASSISGDSSNNLYILRHDKFAVMAANAAKAAEEENGIQIAFEQIFQAEESVKSGIWGAIARGDLQAAEDLFPLLGENDYNEAAITLQSHGYIAEALSVARDEKLRFDLALEIGNLQLCAEIIRSSSSSSTIKRQSWAAVGDAALQKGLFTLAAAAFWECGDYPSLLLLYSSSGDVKRLRQLAAAAAAAQQQQVAFLPAYPSERSDAFPDLEIAKQAEDITKELYKRKIRASNYNKIKEILEADILNTLQEQGPHAEQQQQQQQQQQYSVPYAAAANPFARQQQSPLGSRPGSYEGALQQQQQQQQQQQLYNELQHEHRDLAQQLQQQQDFLEEEAKRLDDDSWGAAEGTAAPAAAAAGAAAAATEEEADRYCEDTV